MNTMIYYSFNVLILSAVILLVGLIKPKWVLFWLDKPGRLPVVAIAGALFMGGAVMFGEGNRQLQQEKAHQAKIEASQPAPKDLPTPAPTAPAAPSKP